MSVIWRSSPSICLSGVRSASTTWPAHRALVSFSDLLQSCVRAADLSTGTGVALGLGRMAAGSGCEPGWIASLPAAGRGRLGGFMSNGDSAARAAWGLQVRSLDETVRHRWPGGAVVRHVRRSVNRAPVWSASRGAGAAGGVLAEAGGSVA